METNPQIFKPQDDNAMLNTADQNATAAIKLTAEEKDKFFKSFLSDKPYIETYSLMNGAFNVTFKTLSVAENGEVLRQVNRDQDSGSAKNNDSYFIQIMLYRLGLSIVSINGEAFELLLDKNKDDDSDVLHRSKVFSTWPVYKLVGLQTVFRAFENKVLKLTSCLEDPDFWKANA